MIAIDTALYLADYLVRNGVQRVYLAPDPEVVHALNAFRIREINVVPSLDATSAAMLAAAESAVHRGIGVVICGSGASAVEIAPAAVQAQLEGRSLIAMTIEPNGLRARSNARRTLDLRGIFTSVSKGSYRLSAENASELIPLAWRLATTAPRGVVHLRIFSDELTATVPPARGQAHAPAPPANAELEASVQRASDMIAAARRVVLVLGPDVIAESAETAARILAEHWAAPIVVSPMAKGAVAETDPLFAGVYGGTGDLPIVELIEQSDLVVGLGVTSADFARPWRTSVPVVHLTPVGGADAGFHADVVLVGPLNAVANALPRQSAASEPGEPRAGAARRAVLTGLLAREPDASTLSPRLVISELRRLAAYDVPLAVETDEAGLLAAQHWTVTQPGTFLISNGLGLPGSGLALAVAAALGREGEQVAWLGTDASLLARPTLLAHVQATRVSLPLITFNQGLNIELLRAQDETGYPRVASRYTPLNLEALSGMYGLGYAPARNPDELSNALASALTGGRPVLIDVAGDREVWWRQG